VYNVNHKVWINHSFSNFIMLIWESKSVIFNVSNSSCRSISAGGRKGVRLGRDAVAVRAVCCHDGTVSQREPGRGTDTGGAMDTTGIDGVHREPTLVTGNIINTARLLQATINCILSCVWIIKRKCQSVLIYRKVTFISF